MCIFKDIIEGKLDNVTKLISANITLSNSRDIHNNTPLILACRYKHRDIVEFLIEMGVDKDLYNHCGITAIQYVYGTDIGDLFL